MSLVAGEVGGLWQALASVPDHRRAEGKRYPLASLLLIAVAALLSGRRDQLGIVRWGRKLTAEALASIGIKRARVPAPSVWCEMFKGLDVGALERALGDWVRGEQPAGHVALDGKRLRGSATAKSTGVHLLAAFSASLQGVIGQLSVAPDGNEITAALQLLKTLSLKDVIITGDAIFTQKEICRTIIDGGGDYFFTVKDNQPALKADIALAFGPISPLCRMVAAARPATDGNDRERSWPDRDPATRSDSHAGRPSKPVLEGFGTGVPYHSRTDRAWQDQHRDGLCDHQPDC
jgi:DDE_Tnp_1-associated/Transposase DDE domain